MNSITKANNVNYNPINNSNKTTKSDGTFASYLEAPKTLDGIFKKAADKYNVSENLLKSIAKAESNFDPKVVSKVGAQGIMQLMPKTAAWLGVTDSFDPEQNIMGGAKYIADLLKKYDGNTKLALAAYNAGSGNVAKYGGIPPFKETQNYVVKVMKYMEDGLEVTPTKNPISTPKTFTNPVYMKPITEEGTQSLMSQLDALFSYNDYLKFMEKYMMAISTGTGDSKEGQPFGTGWFN